MTDIKYQARLQVLSQWATEAAGQGHLVPRAADLEAISAARTVEAPGVSREAVEPWLPTIQWLLKQAAFGVVDAHVQLPDELSRPVGAAHAPQAVPADDDSIGEDPADAPAPPALEVSLVAVEAAEAVTVVAEIKPAPPAAKLPKWESDAHEQVKAAVQRFTKPLHDLLTRDANEGDTRLLITDMLCEGLGYDKFRDLTTEYMVKQDFADYGVRIDKQLIAFIEVKRVSQKLSERHLRQVQMYAVNEGVEWMILTNGQVWQAYHLTGGLPVIVNLAFEVDLLGPESLEEKADKMFFLHREALKRRRIDELWKHRAATSPDALLDVILSDSVLDIIRKEIKRNTGITTTVQTLAAVIRTEIVDPKLRNTW
ncbi:type I restriction enzyme HsdR N-terminal domain-containing protein [Arthrobacter oryzae]|uniref:type I restriction enzyme HsdR N-terminal domain-containing protein n=1 Tax=Arthrobacter oryzae TaxID=409290 RepID=UPI002855923F|nr:type I restriction enzyme HsdR N-terminal domain-containing protein [Arthrobacter oryzae]MDR6506739.1 hypothetical protein [Arthrobacter oryzae]